MKIPKPSDAIYGDIRPEDSNVTSEEEKQKKRDYYQRKKAEQKAMKLATGQQPPKEPRPEPNMGTTIPNMGRPKSVVNRVTEYGALFNKLNDERAAKGLPPLKTAMEVLIDAMQSDELDIKDKAKIADKLAPFESSRAPIISIEHVNNVNKEEEVSADDALDDFLQSLRKV
jgi:phosphopantetheine adenylyltransferase